MYPPLVGDQFHLI